MTARLDLSLTTEEVEDYLETQRTVRLATCGGDGIPHVVPLWFVWHDGILFMNSTAGNVTVENGLGSGRAAGVVDDGETYDALRGVVLTGSVERGDDDPRLADVALKWSAKYLGGAEIPYKRWKHRLWLRLAPESVASWDFRKIPEARAKRDRGSGGLKSEPRNET